MLFGTNSEPVTERNTRSFEVTKLWGLTVAGFTLALFFVFAFLGYRGRGVVAGVSAFSITFVAGYLWDLRSKPWFWFTLVVVIWAHSYLVLSIPWPSLSWGPRGLAPVALIDVFLIRLIFWLVERIMGLCD